MKKRKGLVLFALAPMAFLSLVSPLLAWNGIGGHKFTSRSGLTFNGKYCRSNLEVWDQPAQLMMVRVRIGEGDVHRVYAYDKENYTLSTTTIGGYWGYNTCYAGYGISQR